MIMNQQILIAPRRFLKSVYIRNRACISPLCVTPSASHLHIPYHNKARDEHPLNDPTEHLQIIENTTLH